MLKRMTEALKQVNVVKPTQVLGIALSLLPSDETALSAHGFTQRPTESDFGSVCLVD